MSVFTLFHLLFDHFQFALIHGPNIPGSYAILFFTALNLASITSSIHNCLSQSSKFSATQITTSMAFLVLHISLYNLDYIEKTFKLFLVPKYTIYLPTHLYPRFQPFVSVSWCPYMHPLRIQKPLKTLKSSLYLWEMVYLLQQTFLLNIEKDIMCFQRN